MSEVNETPIESTTPPQEVTESAPVEKVDAPKSEEKADGPLSEETLEKADVQADEAEEEKPKKSRFQERIDKLTADKYAAEREARELRDRIARLEGRQRPPVDPDDYEAQEAERFRRVMEEERRYETYEAEQSAVQKAQAARQELFRAKLEAARDRIPDLDQSIQQFAQLPVTPESAEIIADSDKAAEIAHYLGRNPQLAYEIANLSPAMQGRAIAQIESRVSLPPKKVSAAPPPPQTLKPASAPQAKSPEEMTAAEYVEWRKKQWNS